ncbi:hypothetical protein HDU96_008914 [Phlyctochytrium bullatum]|nr:hypothetical protein HDU96_008914 [Phlyctochytrium bullatum]
MMSAAPSPVGQTGGKSTALVQDGRKKVHTTFPDGSELVEEFDLKTDEILIRRWRRKTVLGALTDWTYEIGEPAMKKNINHPDVLLVESSQNPQLSRKDTRDEFVFRIRNLPYPKPTYQLSIEDRKIVVRTTNKKYFTRIPIPDLDRFMPNEPLDPRLLSYDHGANTLVIRYRKPPFILQKEEAERRERAKIRTDKPPAKDGDVDCKTQ